MVSGGCAVVLPATGPRAGLDACPAPFKDGACRARARRHYHVRTCIYVPTTGIKIWWVVPLSKASRHEREFLHLLAKDYIIGRFAASGAINTVVGDLVAVPRRDSGDTTPRIIEVKYTSRSVYYPSANVHLLHTLSKRFCYRPVLAVRFKGAGWSVHDLTGGVPRRVDRTSARFYRIGELKI